MTKYDSDIEAVLGGGSPHDALERPERRRARSFDQPLELTATRNGVTVYWLSQVFKMTPENVRRRLADVPPMSSSGKGYRYDVKTAAEYLVEPKVDIVSYMKNMRPGDLPPLLQKEIWDARLKRQKWEAAAGDLWHTQDVLAVLSEVFATVKSTIQLWPDSIERTVGITDEQREVLVRMGDALQDEIYSKLQENAKSRSTKASIALLDEDEDELDDLIG